MIFLFPVGAECKIRRKIKRSGSLDLPKSLVERVRTRGSAIAVREADKVENNQVETKATHGTKAKQASGNSIVWSCSTTLK